MEPELFRGRGDCILDFRLGIINERFDEAARAIGVVEQRLSDA